MFRMVLMLSAVLVGAAPVAAASPAAPLLKLLESGRVPTERLPAFVEMICQRGDASDLAFIYQQTVDPEGYTGDARLTALRALAEAATTRDVRPAGDLSGLGQFLKPTGDAIDPPTQLAAIQLAGAWKTDALLAPLKELALNETADQKVRRAAIGALVGIGGEASQQALDELTAAERPFDVRALAVSGLAQSNLDAAAQKAAKMLTEADEREDLGLLLSGFLDLQGGPERLGAAIAANKPSKDLAKLALRYLYASGRTDPPLIGPLSDAAGISASGAPPTPEQVASLAADVAAKGNAARGEIVFRRTDLSCIKCHSVSKAGGEIGPDLSPVGANSPVDYLVRSVLNPSQDIKEAYLTTIILTEDGKQYQGIVVDRDERRVELKDANGETLTVPTADIDEELEGRSLMPSGLTNFMTRSELVDLVAFLSQLGKPGAYAIRSTETIQRWRVLKEVSSELASAAPSAELIRSQVLEIPEAAWEPAYAKVAGQLPLEELRGKILYLKGEVDVTEPGVVGVQINSMLGATVWIDDQPQSGKDQFELELPRGRHAVILRIDNSERDGKALQVELSRPEGSMAQFEAVGGK